MAAYCCLVKGIFSNTQTVEKLLGWLPHSIEAINEAKSCLKEAGYQAEVYGRNVKQVLFEILKEASMNLEADEMAMMRLWYPLIENEVSMQGVDGK